MRSRKLVSPNLQLRLSLWFVGVVTAGLLLQSILVSRNLTALAQTVPGDAAALHAAFSKAAWNTLWTSLLVVLPLSVGVGILATFRLAGPLARFRAFLEGQGLWDDAQEAALEHEQRSAISAAVKGAEQAPLPGPETLLDDVYAVDPPVLDEQRALLRDELAQQ